MKETGKDATMSTVIVATDGKSVTVKGCKGAGTFTAADGYWTAKLSDSRGAVRLVTWVDPEGSPRATRYTIEGSPAFPDGWTFSDESSKATDTLTVETPGDASLAV
jgi:hypothetical protein